MTTHPSVFELDVFVRNASTSAEFERHVSACDECAARLQRLAQRTQPVSLALEVPQERQVYFAAVALMACLMVLLVRGVPGMSFRVDSYAPEGVHGVPVLKSATSSGWAETEPVDSGIRIQ